MSMAEAIDWGILITAAASLVFALMAYRTVIRTTSRVDGFVAAGRKFLASLEDGFKGILDPSFVADVITQTCTKDIQNPDGSPVSMPQFIGGYISAYGPGLKKDLLGELPKLVPLLLNPSNPPPSGGMSPGQALAAQRWGSGGLKAAQQVGKAAGKVGGIGGRISDMVEQGTAVVQLIPVLKELKAELGGMRGAGNGGNGGNGEAATSPTSSGITDWGPPF